MTDPATARRLPRRTSWILLAAAVIGAVGGGATWAVTRPDRLDGASCPAVITFRGVDYMPFDDVVRMPPSGRTVGTATFPPCADTEQPADPAEDVAASTIDGYNPDRVILAAGLVWGRAGTEAPGNIEQKLSRPVPCTPLEPFTVVGTMTNYLGKPVERSNQPIAPYRSHIVVTDAPALDIGGYASVTIVIRVTARTDGGTDPDLNRQALSEGAPIAITVTCEAGRFIAQRMELAP